MLRESPTNLSILFLKTIKVFEFRRLGSKLFYSMIVEGNMEFLKKLCLMLKKGMLSTFLVAYAWTCSDISFKKVLETFAFVNFVEHS